MVGIDDAEGDEPTDQVRVHARHQGELVQAQPRSADHGVCHCRSLGLKSDSSASCSNSRRSVRESRSGTMILASAYRSPALPFGLGRPWPRSRIRLPLDVPPGTFTLTSPAGVSTATDVPRAASH